MWKIIVLYMIVSLTSGRILYNNYKVFKITPTAQSQIEKLHRLEKHPGYSFWKSVSVVNQTATLMVAPDKVDEFREKMKEIHVLYDIEIDDVQHLINAIETSRTQSTTFNLFEHNSLFDIYKNLHDLSCQYPDKVQLIIGGTSYEGRQIKGVKITFNACSNQSNPGIFLEGGIYARQWISPAIIMYILHQLLTSENPDVRALAERHDWYIFPIINPDGYEYSRTTDRLWKNTRKPYVNEHNITCIGTDLNRNWNFRWNTVGFCIRNPGECEKCDDKFAGLEAFSEIEARSMSEYIRSISDKFYAYISFHGFSQYLLLPYGYTRDHPENYDEMHAIAVKTIEAIKKRYGTEYRTGSGSEILGEISGTSMDYIKVAYGTPLVYTYELGRHQFLLLPDQITPTGEETMDSLVAMFKEAKARGLPRNSTDNQSLTCSSAEILH